MHTIKGNARTYGLLHLTNKVHESEQRYEDLRKNPEAEWIPDLLLQQLEETHALIREYAKINEKKLGRKGPGRRGSIEKYLLVERDHIQQALTMLEGVDKNDLSALHQVLQKVGLALNQLGTEKIGEILEGIVESLPSLAAELGKSPPVISIQDHGIQIRNQAAGLLRSLFTHLYRNAIDHGIEKPEERLAVGKPPEGHIHLELSLQQTGSLQMRMRDDGRGLPVARIRKVAVDKSIIGEGEAHSPESIARLIFVSGFSTAEKISEVSGRGVGMDAVKGFLEKEGGSIEIRFLNDDAGADFRSFETLITLPGKFALQVES
jgi:chemotaxis protein histidine kinase CheA